MSSNDVRSSWPSCHVSYVAVFELQKTPPSKEKTETNATSASTDTLKDPARVIKDRPVNTTLRKEQAVGFANPRSETGTEHVGRNTAD